MVVQTDFIIDPGEHDSRYLTGRPVQQTGSHTIPLNIKFKQFDKCLAALYPPFKLIQKMVTAFSLLAQQIRGKSSRINPNF